MKRIWIGIRSFFEHKVTRTVLWSLGVLLLVAAVTLSAVAFFERGKDNDDTAIDDLLAAWEQALEKEDGGAIATLEEKMAQLRELLLQDERADAVYDKILPSTVSVLTYYKGQSALGYGGSGFFISEDGLIATAYHVVEGSDSIRVRTSDKKYHNVSYIAGYDRDLDVAILKIDLENTVPITANTEVQNEGETLYALGRNSGVDFTFTTGILAYTGDVHASYPKRKMIRYCNLTQKGDSGCAIFNSHGESIGMCQIQDSTYGTMQWGLTIAQVLSVPTDLTLSVPEFASREAQDLTDYLSYYEKEGKIFVTGLSRSLPATAYVVKVPATVDGLPVTSVSFDGSIAMPEVRQLILPEGIKVLSRAVLSKNSKIASLHIPASVTTVTTDAFLGATSLRSITSASTAVSATEERAASADGRVLYRLFTVPEDGVLSLAGVSVLADHAAYGKAITALTDTESLTEIGAYALGGTKLETLTLPDTVKTLGECALLRTPLTTLHASGVRTIGKRALYQCSSLSSLTLGKTLVRIEDEAFYGCASLSSVTLPEGLAYVGTAAFSGTAIAEIALPVSLSYLAANAFANNPSLSSVTFASLPYLEALSAFGSTAQIENITFRLPAALDGEAEQNSLYKTLFTIGNKLFD